MYTLLEQDYPTNLFPLASIANQGQPVYPSLVTLIGIRQEELSCAIYTSSELEQKTVSFLMI
jgi:hypothetical protein